MGGSLVTDNRVKTISCNGEVFQFQYKAGAKQSLSLIYRDTAIAFVEAGDLDFDNTNTLDIYKLFKKLIGKRGSQTVKHPNVRGLDILKERMDEHFEIERRMAEMLGRDKNQMPKTSLITVAGAVKLAEANQIREIKVYKRGDDHFIIITSRNRKDLYTLASTREPYYPKVHKSIDGCVTIIKKLDKQEFQVVICD